MTPTRATEETPVQPPAVSVHQPTTTTAPANTRIRRILDAGKTRAALVRVLRKHFTTAELGQLFDGIPEGPKPVEILAEAIGTAWSQSQAADGRASGQR